MPRFIGLMNAIHAVVGDRPAYVASFPDGYPGLVYFVADLNPAPISVEPNTLVLTRAELVAYSSDFVKRVLPQTQALLTADLGRQEAEAFLAAYKNARKVVFTYRGKPYYVLLRR